MVTTSQIEQGIATWLDTELMPQLQMDGWKRVVAGAAMGVVVKRSGQMLDNLASSPLFTSLEISKDGEIDIDIIAEELMNATPDQGFTIDLPLIGTMTIHRQDIDNLHRMIKGNTMDVIVKLRERVREEEHDIEIYEKLKHEAKEKGMHNLADALDLVIKDEKSHRDYFKMYIEEWENESD